jgi:hypothetical protein
VTQRTLERPVTGVRNDHDLPTTNASTPRGDDNTVGSRRRGATEAHLRAISTINALFDRVDELIEARGGLTGVAPLGPDDDPIRDAEVLLQHAELLNQAVAGVRSAALDASVSSSAKRPGRRRPYQGQPAVPPARPRHPHRDHRG